MKYEELEKKLKRLHERYKKETNNLKIKYALEHNEIKVGYIIQDHIGFVKVEKIGVEVLSAEKPTCVYSGLVLTIKKVPKKDKSQRIVYQENLIQIIKGE